MSSTTSKIPLTVTHTVIGGPRLFIVDSANENTFRTSCQFFVLPPVGSVIRHEDKTVRVEALEFCEGTQPRVMVPVLRTTRI